jgi:predicted nucleotidyltransferase
MKKSENVKEIIKILRQNYKVISNTYGVMSIAVFGSYAKNKQKKRSDIDIFVDLKEKYKTFDNFMELKFFLEKIVGRKIDLLIKESIREELKQRIFKEAVYV